ncbi:MAG: MFS transporter [Acidobacteria bacterium]|nr:MFS transporter [Acidobacteriota bacterium]
MLPFGEITGTQWRTLLAAMLGWMLDALDVMLYSFALLPMQKEFGLTGAQAGTLTTVTLAAAAAGGTLAGILADRYGRTKVLMGSILTYSLFTALIATAQSFEQLLLWRTLVGLGLGAEWSAGTVLVAETWPAAHRGKAIGITQSGWAIGYLAAAGLAALILPTYGWRPLFAIGALPALLALWIRRSVPEPQVWRDSMKTPLRERFRIIFSPPLGKYAVLAIGMSSFVLFAYWGLFTWVPAYLATPVEKGGAGLSIVRSSAWIAPMQIGALAGYLLFGVLADRFGRRPSFAAFLTGAAIVTVLYGGAARSPQTLLWLGPLVGLFGHGYYSAFGAILSEIFPSTVRATAQGLCYNGGRILSAFAPAVIGAVADRQGLGSALTLTAAFFLIGGVLVFALPETKGRSLSSV